MKLERTFAIIFFETLSILSSYGDVNRGAKSKSQINVNNVQAGCFKGIAQASLDINNVRTTILTGGDIWWNGVNTAQYEIPKWSGLHSMYAGALWIGGTDAGGNLKVAAQTYSQTGEDFWPGAIDIPNTTITPPRCSHYDRVWKITKTDVLNFIAGGPATADMISYPGNGDAAFGEDQFLAPFFDANADGIYNIASGDYPNYNFNSASPGGSNCNNYLFGDQTIW